MRKTKLHNQIGTERTSRYRSVRKQKLSELRALLCEVIYRVDEELALIRRSEYRTARNFRRDNRQKEYESSVRQVKVQGSIASGNNGLIFPDYSVNDYCRIAQNEL